MDIALDVIVVAIIIFTIWRASVKGFIRSIFDMLKFIVSMIAATVFKGGVANFIMGSKIYESVGSAAERKLTESISKAVNNGGTGGILDAFRDKNPDIVKIIESMGGDFEKTKTVVENAAIKGGRDLTYVAAEYILDPILTSIAYILAFMFVFIVAYLILSIVEAALNAVFNLPVLNRVNKAGGVAVGIVCAILYSTMFVAITSPFVSNPDMIGGDWDKNTADKTLIYSYIDNHNILSVFMNE